MSTRLLKHPNEVRRFWFEFGTFSGQGQRDVYWDCTPYLDTARGEEFSAGLSMPLLLGSMVGSEPTMNLIVTRDDGQTSDLTTGTPQASGTRIGLAIGGGTVGREYTLTITAASTNLGNTIVGQGRLAITGTLP